MRFNHLTAIRWVKPNYWLFHCEHCGKDKVLRSGAVVFGSIKSCGCLGAEKTIARNKARRKDETGKRYGYLIGLCHVEKTLWLWRCERCGENRTIDATQVRHGECRSCGCWGRERLGVYQQTKAFNNLLALLPEEGLFDLSVLEG
jgi:hypothetical protein